MSRFLCSPSTKYWWISAALWCVYVGAAFAQAAPEDGGVAPIEAQSAAELADAAVAPAEPVSPALIAPDAALPESAPPVLATPAPAAAPAQPAAEPFEKGVGTLTGTIKAADIGMGLEGASVFVRGREFQTHTDGNGAFKLQLPSGVYQLFVIYPEYSTLSVSKVEVRANKTAALNLELHPGSTQFDEYVITGSRVEGGIATLLAERRDSTAVADVIGSEQMARSGDSNAAAALSRVTGITIVDGRYVLVRGMGERYSSMTLNGFQVASPDPTRRVVPLDIFPAGVIESVLVQKTYSPNLPGEFGGGLVQLRSRDYPNEFLLSFNVATGGNTNTTFLNRATDDGGRFDLLGVDDGTRALPDSFPNTKITEGIEGIPDSGGFTPEEIKQFGKDLPKHYDTHNERVPPDLTLVGNVGNEFRLRYAKIGFVAAAGYKNEFRTIRDAINRPPNQPSESRDDFRVTTYRRQISLSGFLDWGVEFSKHQKLKFTTMLLRQTDDNTQIRELPDGNPPNKRTILQWVERQVFLQQVSGTHAFPSAQDFQIDWRYAFGRATRGEPNRRQYVYLQKAPDDPYTFSDGSDGNQSAFGDLADDTHEGALDLTQPFHVWKRLLAKVKAGGLVYYRDRKATTRRYTFRIRRPGDLDLTQQPDAILNDQHVESGAIELQDVALTTDAYDAYMLLEAGYGMLELPIARSLDVMAGARIEHARIEAETFDPFDVTAPKIKSKLDNVDALPSATVTWRFAEDFQARGGYSRTLNRPDLREISPSKYFDLETNLLYIGNPEVQRALIDNYDLRFEWYYTPDEVFSIGGFIKDFTNPIETSFVSAAEDIYTVNNEDHAISYGLELEGRKHFGFFGKALEPLYLASNVSLINSNVDVALDDGGVHSRPLQGQSPWVVNVQLGWDNSGEGGTGTSASLLYNSAGRRIRIIGDPTSDPATNIGDTYEEPIHRLDFVVAQKLKHGFNIGARARNMLNALERWTRDGDLIRRQRRGVDLQLSLSWSY